MPSVNHVVSQATNDHMRALLKYIIPLRSFYRPYMEVPIVTVVRIGRVGGGLGVHGG